MAAAPAPKVAESAKSFSPKEVLLSPIFWLLYIMFVMVSASGLMATAQIAPIASDFKVGNEIVFWGATTLTAALIIDNIAHGAARPLFGWISDSIGRELTMAIAFGLGGLSYWLLGSVGAAPWPWCSLRRSFFSPGARSSACFPRPAPTRSVRSSHGEFGPAVYCQGHLGLPGAGGKPDQIVDRRLAHGVRCNRAYELHRSRLGAFRAQTDAGARHKALMTAGSRRVAIGRGSMPRPFSWIGQEVPENWALPLWYNVL